MSRFLDIYPPECMPGYPCISSPRWSTTITRVKSGAEQVLQNWQHPLWRFTLPEAVRSQEIFEAVRDHWLAMRGPVHTWPFRDPLDFASRALARPNVPPAVTAMDQVIGTGSGSRTRFQLVKTYQRGPQTYTRRIELPLADSVVVSVNGIVQPSGWSVTRPGGELVFAVAPPAGHVIRAGFLFDVHVRFESDDAFDGIVQGFAVAGFADISLVEVPMC